MRFDYYLTTGTHHSAKEAQCTAFFHWIRKPPALPVEAPRSANYIERFKAILVQQAELKAKRAVLEQQQAEDTESTRHMELAADMLEQAGTAITEWDE